MTSTSPDAFHRTAAHSQDVESRHAVHAGVPIAEERAADGGRDEGHQQCNQRDGVEGGEAKVKGTAG